MSCALHSSRRLPFGKVHRSHPAKGVKAKAGLTGLILKNVTHAFFPILSLLRGSAPHASTIASRLSDIRRRWIGRAATIKKRVEATRTLKSAPTGPL